MKGELNSYKYVHFPKKHYGTQTIEQNKKRVWGFVTLAISNKNEQSFWQSSFAFLMEFLFNNSNI